MSSLTLSDDTPTNSTYKLVSSKNNEMIFRDAASSLDNPRMFQTAATVSGTNNGTDRFLVKMTRVDDDADGVPYTATTHIVIAKPREGVSSADLKLEFEKLKNYVVANWDDIVAGFMPTLV